MQVETTEITVGRAQRKEGFTHSTPSTYFIFILSPLKRNVCFIPLPGEGCVFIDNGNCLKYPMKSSERVSTNSLIWETCIRELKCKSGFFAPIPHSS